MGEKIKKESKVSMGPNEKVIVNDEDGKPLLAIRRFKKGTIHINLQFKGKAYTYDLDANGKQRIYIYPKKKGD